MVYCYNLAFREYKMPPASDFIQAFRSAEDFLQDEMSARRK
jgi:hypothetical protein